MSTGGGQVGGGGGEGGLHHYGPRGRNGLQVLMLVRGRPRLNLCSTDLITEGHGLVGLFPCHSGGVHTGLTAATNTTIHPVEDDCKEQCRPNETEPNAVLGVTMWLQCRTLQPRPPCVTPVY